jgi:hypothetical protein
MKADLLRSFLTREEVQSKPSLIRDVNYIISGLELNDESQDQSDEFVETSTWEYLLENNAWDANELLEFAVFSPENNFKNYSLDSFEKKYFRSLVKLAIKYGADVNLHYVEHPNKPAITLLHIAKDPEVIQILKGHGASCSNSAIDEIINGGLEEVLINPSIIIEQKYQNLNATRVLEQKMPYTLNFIWLTEVTPLS